MKTKTNPKSSHLISHKQTLLLAKFPNTLIPALWSVFTPSPSEKETPSVTLASADSSVSGGRGCMFTIQ